MKKMYSECFICEKRRKTLYYIEIENILICKKCFDDLDYAVCENCGKNYHSDYYIIHHDDRFGHDYVFCGKCVPELDFNI